MELRFRKIASILRVGLGLLVLVLLVVQTQAQTRPQPPVPLPTPFTPIVDYANIIDADTRQRLESIYLNLKDRGNVVYSVLTVQTTGEQDIFDYSLAIARGWGIGPKNAETPSFLLVVAIQDRKYFTQVSQHLEGELPDGLVGRIQRERLVPAFRQGNYSKGIYDTVQAYVATVASKRGFSVEGIDQRYAYSGGNEGDGAVEIRELPSRGSLRTICCGIVIVVFIVILIAGASRGGGGRGGRRRRRGFGGGGLLEAILWGSVLGNLSGGGRGWGSSSGWGSSGGFGGGGFGGGGSGGFGGGFGGGDSFGGGGAGGSW